MMKKKYLFVFICCFIFAKNFGQCPNAPTNYPTVSFSFVTQTDARLTITANNTPAVAGYLVVQSTFTTIETTPANGTTYTVGSSFGTGTVISNGSSTIINLTGLTTGTNYYYFVYPYYNCTVSPTYKSTSTPYTLLRTVGLACVDENFESYSNYSCGNSTGQVFIGSFGLYQTKACFVNDGTFGKSIKITNPSSWVFLPVLDNIKVIEFYANVSGGLSGSIFEIEYWSAGSNNWVAINYNSYKQGTPLLTNTPYKRYIIDLQFTPLISVGSTILRIRNTVGNSDGIFDNFKIYCLGNNVDCPPKAIWHKKTDETRPYWYKTLNDTETIDPSYTQISTITPQSNISVILDTDYDTATYGDFEACSVIVNTGVTLNINGTSSYNYVSIVKELQVKNSAIVNIEDKNSLIMVNNGSSVNLVGTGIINTKKTTKAQSDWNFTYWSSPVTNDTSGPTISNIFFSNPVYPSSMDAYKIFKYDATKFNDSDGDGLDDDDPYTTNWVWQKPTETKMIPGVGYIVNSYPGGQAAKTYTFSGKINNGIINVPIYSSANTNVLANYSTDYDDWNLIGNPYSSALNAASFLSDPNNISIIGGTALLWTQTNVVDIGNTGYANYKNFNNGDYSYYNISGYLPADINATPVSNLYIASGQSFMVEGIANNGTTALAAGAKIGDVTFSNSMRYGSYVNNYKIFPPFDNTVFYKPSKTSKKTDATDDNSNKIWLSLSETQGAFSQTLVSFFDYDASKMENATDGIDRAYDAIKFISGNYVDIYSLIDEQPYAIQGRTSLTDDAIIPLGYNTNITGTLKIEIKNRLGAIADKDIFLEDKLFPNLPYHNLSNSPYEFEVTESETNDNRFNLKFQEKSLTVDTIKTELNKVIVNSNNNLLLVKSTEETINTIIIYDLLGRILTKVNPNKKEYEFNMSQINKGSIVIVKTFLNNQTITINKTIIF